MKKTIYSILAVAAGVIFAGGCSKEINPVENRITLSASLPGELTKAVVDDTDNTQVNWSAGDAISVWGGENNKFTLSSGEDTTSASFSGTLTSGTAKYAMYPYSATATSDDYGIITTNVPNTQTAPQNSFDPAAAIVVGAISGTTINFNHALSYLKITAPDEVDDLIEITIESNGEVQLTGDAMFDAADGDFTATGTPCKYVTIKPSTGTFVAGGIYYAAVIPGTYTGGLTVKYIYSDDTNYKLIGKSKSNSTAFALSAGTAKLLGAANLETCTTYDVAVQLWAGGPYWAKTNIGATSETNYGQYFAWGYPIGQTPYKEGVEWDFSTSFDKDNYPDLDKDTLDATHDMATVNWSTSWSVPTNDDLSNLISDTKTNIEYVKSGSENWETYNVRGLLITGKDAYTSNSIFLPVAGHGQNTDCHDPGQIGLYWSSVQGSSSAYFLYIEVEREDEDDDESDWMLASGVYDDKDTPKYTGMSVRPVRSL